MKIVIVSGCTGFIGSNLAEQLLKDGHIVVGIDDMSTGTYENLDILEKYDNFEFVKCDITDNSDMGYLQYYIKQENHNIQVVFHAAACARIQPAIQNPERTHEVNVTGIFNILQLMRKLKIPKIIFSSSSSIYGLKNEMPQNEDQPADCLNPYSLSKFIGENYIKTFCKMYGMAGVNLRYFNVWGPREFLDGDFAPIVGLFFRKLFQEKKPLTIVGDGRQLRDHTFVGDVVSANIKAMDCSTYLGGEIINIGTGKNCSILELVDMVLKSLELDKSHMIFVPARPAEARDIKADNNKAKRLLGWEPQIFLNQETINMHRDYYKNLWNIK